jgi:hypothetical protein
MPCAKHKSADERRYLEAFGAIRGYTMTGEGLLLTGVGGRTLFRLAR